jgi:quercetin dioxygenase-like cupin family protein
MVCSRREWCWLLPALAASAAFAKPESALPSKTYRFEDLPVRKSGENSFRPVLQGKTHSGFPIELHESALAPGEMPHPAHRHPHEEMFLVREGTLEVTIDGRSARLGPGSVAFVASGAEHGVRNPGRSPAQYFVLALGSE